MPKNARNTCICNRKCAKCKQSGLGNGVDLGLKRLLIYTFNSSK